MLVCFVFALLIGRRADGSARTRIKRKPTKLQGVRQL